MPETDAHGPVDYLVLEFPDGADTSGPAAELRALVEQGTILLYDLVVVARDTDGSVRVAPDSGPDAVTSAFGEFSGARSGLVDSDDVLAAAEVLDPGAVGVVVVYENAWAAPFVAAARRVGGEVVAGARITAQELMDVLDALDTTDPAA